MLKRFIVSFVMCLLVLSSQIVSAADIDWDSVPRIGSKAELAKYIEDGRRNGQTEFHFVLTNKLKTSKEEFDNGFEERAGKQFMKMAYVLVANIHGTHFTDGTVQMTCKITEYPGTRVANAYLSGDTSNLTAEEQNLYNIAVGIVNEANKRSSEREKARYIHDVICDSVKEFKNENERNKTAVGALIDGYAQCQGYSDAFYMLGLMSRLNVCRIGGYFNKEPHVWNWIMFSDGKSYCVDVTNGYITKSDYLFCATKERMEKTHSCEWEIIPNLQ